MKKKFILLAMMLLTLIGGVNLNVLNAQEQYRIKSVSTGKYLHIFNHDQHSGGQFGGVGVSDYEESVNQIFTFEPNSTGYRVKSADGYYIYCQQWNVDAYNTSSYFSTTLTGFDFNGESFSIGRMYSSSEYFKVEYVSAGGNTYVFCNCTGNGDGTIETWKLEPVIVDDGIIPADPTNLVATAIDHKSISLTWTAGDENALKYNIYQGGVNIGSTTATSYTVEGLTAETNYCFTVEAVRGVNVSESHSNEACATTSEAPAIQDMEVGDGTGGTSNLFPTHFYYKYSLTQQIYTASELGFGAGKISGISFYGQVSYTRTRTIDVYIRNIDETKFNNNTDWKAISSDDKVYSGSFTNKSGWVDIVFDKDFEYEGGNILICIDDNTGSYSANTPYYMNANTDDIKALSLYTDVTNYDPFNIPNNVSDTSNSNNYIKFTVEVSTDPSIEVNYPSLYFGTVRAGGDFWTEKEIPSFDVEVTAKNTTIESVSIDDDFFTSDKDLATAAGQTEFNFTVSYNKEAEAGEKSGNIVVTYMNGEEEATVEIPMTATAYVPAEGDVIENPFVVTFDENGTYTNTPTFANMKDDYSISGETDYGPEGNNPDAVYKLVLEEKSLMNATVDVGSWTYVYDADFGGEGGPKVGNQIYNGLANIVLEAGTYYVVVATNGTFTFTMTASSVPAPTISYSNPTNESANNDNPMLQWNMQYADEYQVLFGTSEDALETVIDWNAVPQPEPSYYSYPTSGLQNNTKYYWQVIATNEAGTTTGEVRSFVTLLDVPQITSPTTVNLYPGETTTITWEAVANATSYKVYNGEWTVLATLEATEEPSYELSGLEYNMTGYNITVTATQDLGESLKSTSVVVKVAGTFPLTVNVKDSNNTPIEGATVTINVSNAYDQFQIPVEEVEVEPTNAEGKTTVTLPLLSVSFVDNETGYYKYPSYTVDVSQTPYDGGSQYIGYSGLANGTEKSIDFTLYLPAPSNLYAEEDMLLAGDNLTLNWTAVEGATGYNVYKRGAYNNSTWTYEYELLGTSTENTYTAVAEYDGEGSYYAVSAVFEGGLESDKTSTYNRIYVLGTGDVKGLVTDTDDNPVAGAALELSGTNGFGEDIYILETEADGTFLVEDVIEGTYSLTVSHYNYEVATVSGISVNYNIEYDLGTIELTPKASIENVTVTADNNGNVSWTGDYAKWNVYRRNTNAPQELTSVATKLEATSTTDAEWETLEPGRYQYGVAALVEPQAQTRGTEVIFEERFENNGTNIPTGWSSWNSSGSSSPIDWTPATRLNYGSYNSYEGTYSAFSNGTSGGGYAYIQTIDIELSGEAYMNFYYIAPSWGGDINSLIIKVIPQDTYEEYEVFNTNKTNCFAWTSGYVDLSGYQGKTIKIQFICENGYGYGVGIDDIVITGEVTSEVETQIVWSNEVVKQGPATFIGEDTDNPTAWNVDANWSTGSVPAAGADVTINANAVISSEVNVSNLTINNGDSYPYNKLTVANGGALTVTGLIKQESNYQLVLEEGGQIFQNNNNVTARFRMSIDNPSDWSNTSNKDGWQFISMPFNDALYSDFAGTYNPSTGQNTCDYDLYKYDGSQDLEWLNYRENDWYEDKFMSGYGYLASRKEVSTVNMYGTLNVANPFAYRQYAYSAEKPLVNFHLVGNPFSHDINWTDFTISGTYFDSESGSVLENIQYFVDGYAIVDNNGNYQYYTSADNEPIKVGQGFFIKTLKNKVNLGYTPKRSAKSASNNSLNITATGNAGEDNVIINLAGKSEGFDKLQNFNDAIATVYVAEDGKNYGIYNCDADVQEVELSFNANQMGNYTISIEPNGKFQTVTLVDRFTGIETNMLVEDYHFTAMSNVNTNRFIVKLAVSDQQSAVSDNFVYQSGEELIVEAEGRVQIIDVMGRVVYSDDVESTNNRINVSDFGDGTYVVRVINETEVKVEKVVIY